MQNPTNRARQRSRCGGGSPFPSAAAGVVAAVVAVAFAPAARLEAQHRVSGRVTAAAGGQPVSDAVVRVQGGTAGTRTDSAGRYAITAASPNDTLLVTRIGYTAQRAAIGGRTTVDVQLAVSARKLEEVVVIGYGEKRRATMTESIGSVSEAEIQQVPIASADQALQGRVSGAQVTSSSGTPGSPVAVRIRGVSTVGNTQPLFVVDGVPAGRGTDPRTNPLATINPSDIESISVLKDASAAAVYGVQASNGVVLITTKRGQLGKPTVRYDAYAGVQRLPPLWEMNDTRTYVQLVQEAYDNFNAQNNLKPTDASFLKLHPDLQGSSRYLSRNTDWLGDAINQNAPIMNHNLSVAGATNQLNYFLSGGYFAQDAVADRWDLNRVSFRANSDYTINRAIRVGETFSVSYQRVTRGVNAGGDGFLLRNAAAMPPFFSIRDEDQRVANNRYGFTGNLNVGGLTIGNQNGINQVVTSNDRLGRVLGSLYAEARLVDRLTLRSQGSVDVRSGYNESWSPGYTAEELGLPRTSQDYNDGRALGTSFVWTNTATFADSIGSHHLNALGGIELQQYETRDLAAAGHNFLSSDPRYYRVARNAETFELFGGAGENAFLGYIGRLSYDYAQRYLITATVRRDGTSTFSPEGNRRWGTFPSVSAAWRVSEEPFFRLPGVTEFKLRGSWGELGNSETAAYPFITRVSVTPDYGLGGNTTVKAPAAVNFVNPNLTWETVRTADFGFEAGLLDNTVDFSATYYRRDTKNFLVSIPIPRITGFSSVPVNAGSVVNTGVELEAGYTPRLARGMRLNVTGNLTTVRNRLTALAPGIEEFLTDGAYRTAVGQPIGYLYGFKTAGIFQTPAEAASALTDRTTGRKAQAGDLRFVDTNGPRTNDTPAGRLFSGAPDGQLTVEDRTYLGKTIPDFYYGFNANAGWRRLDVSVFFQGVQGVEIYNEFRRQTEHLGGGGSNQLRTTANRWTGPGTSNTIPRAVANDPNGNNRISDRWVEDGSFFRLKNLQVGYSLPGNLLGRGVAAARVYVSATNLWTVTGYSGLDPEVQTWGADEFGVSRSTNQLRSGTDQGNIPQPRVFQFGVSLGF